MPPITREQVNTGIRWLITMFGATLAGWFVAWGWGSSDQAMAVLNNPMFQYAVASLVLAIAPLIQGLISKTEKNQVAMTDSLPNVKGVEMKPTEEGKAIAQATPSPTVTVAPVKISPITGAPIVD